MGLQGLVFGVSTTEEQQSGASQSQRDDPLIALDLQQLIGALPIEGTEDCCALRALKGAVQSV